MIKKIFLIFVFQVVVFNYLYAAWPVIFKTKPVKGRIVDATTGKPIENAVVIASWQWGIYSLIPIGEGSTSKLKSEISVTDKEGRYKIKGKTKWSLIPGGPALMGISVIHPLYESKGIHDIYGLASLYKKDKFGEYKSVGGKWMPSEDGSYDYELIDENGKKKLKKLVRSGSDWPREGNLKLKEEKDVIYLDDIQLLSLEEKDKVFSQVYLFKKISGSEGIWAFGFNEEYFNLLSKTKKANEFDLDRYFGEIYEKLEKYKNHQDYESAKKEMQEREKKIRAIMGRRK